MGAEVEPVVHDSWRETWSTVTVVVEEHVGVMLAYVSFELDVRGMERAYKEATHSSDLAPCTSWISLATIYFVQKVNSSGMFHQPDRQSMAMRAISS